MTKDKLITTNTKLKAWSIAVQALAILLLTLTVAAFEIHPIIADIFTGRRGELITLLTTALSASLALLTTFVAVLFLSEFGAWLASKKQSRYFFIAFLTPVVVHSVSLFAFIFLDTQRSDLEFWFLVFCQVGCIVTFITLLGNLWPTLRLYQGFVRAMKKAKAINPGA